MNSDPITPPPLGATIPEPPKEAVSRVRARDANVIQVEFARPMPPRIMGGSSWYHDAAIEDERSGRHDPRD